MRESCYLGSIVGVPSFRKPPIESQPPNVVPPKPALAEALNLVWRVEGSGFRVQGLGFRVASYNPKRHQRDVHVQGICYAAMADGGPVLQVG